MIFQASKFFNNGKAKIYVKIELGDPHKNGHNDFSITADIYEKLKNGRWGHISGGCIHDEILKHFPEFQIFVDLHLSDDNGVPMYPIANNPYTRFFAVEDGKTLIDSITDALPRLKEKAKTAIDMLCEMTGQSYEQSAYSAHLFNETKKMY